MVLRFYGHANRKWSVLKLLNQAHEVLPAKPLHQTRHSIHTESSSRSSSYSSMSVLMLGQSSRPSLSSSAQPTKNLGAPCWLSPGLLGSDITVHSGSDPLLPAAPSHNTTPSRKGTRPNQLRTQPAKTVVGLTSRVCEGPRREQKAE